MWMQMFPDSKNINELMDNVLQWMSSFSQKMMDKNKETLAKDFIYSALLTN